MSQTIFLNYISELKRKLQGGSRLIQIILGPRQAGKTTTTLKLMEEKFNDHFIYHSADSVFNANSDWLRESWLLALEKKKILMKFIADHSL